MLFRCYRLKAGGLHRQASASRCKGVRVCTFQAGGSATEWMSGGYFSASESLRFWNTGYGPKKKVFFCLLGVLLYHGPRTALPNLGSPWGASRRPQKLPGTTCGPRRTFSQFPYLGLNSKFGHSHLVLSKLIPLVYNLLTV